MRLFIGWAAKVIGKMGQVTMPKRDSSHVSSVMQITLYTVARYQEALFSHPDHLFSALDLSSSSTKTAFLPCRM
jgi:hypothetical protein